MVSTHPDLGDARVRLELEIYELAAAAHLAPEDAAPRFAALPPEVAVKALAVAAEEARAPAPEVAAATANVLASLTTPWSAWEVALALWAGTSDAEARLAAHRASWRWEPLARTLSWGVPEDRAAAEAWAERLAEPGLGVDRARLELLRRPQPLPEATDRIARIVHPTMRLQALYEVARREGSAQVCGAAWTSMAMGAAEAATDLDAVSRSLRVATALARAGQEAEARVLWAGVSKRLWAMTPAERRTRQRDALAAAAVVGAPALRELIERLGAERVAPAERALLWESAAAALALVRPVASIGEVLPELTDAGRKRLADGAERIGWLARMVAVVAPTGVRPVDTWLAEIGDRLRRLHREPPASVARAMLVRAARALGTAAPAAAVSLGAAPTRPEHRALWTAGLAQSRLDTAATPR